MWGCMEVKHADIHHTTMDTHQHYSKAFRFRLRRKELLAKTVRQRPRGGEKDLGWRSLL